MLRGVEAKEDVRMGQSLKKLGEGAHTRLAGGRVEVIRVKRRREEGNDS